MEEPEGVRPDDLEDEIEWAVEDQLKSGRTTDEVTQALVDQGWDRDVARREVMRVAEALIDWKDLTSSGAEPLDDFKSRVVIAVILALIAPLLWDSSPVRMAASMGVGLAALVQFFRGLFGFMDWVAARVRR